jgi:hypothetical protein
MGPKVVGFLSLRDTVGSEVSIFPRSGCISIQFSPVAIPSRSTVEGFGGIMPAFTVAAEKEKLVVNIFPTLMIEA